MYLRIADEGGGHGARDDLFIFFQIGNGSQWQSPVRYLGWRNDSNVADKGENAYWSPKVSAYKDEDGNEEWKRD